jgi:very-short-patch-repair endonuclease
VLEDAEAGVHSVLESSYLGRVERAHGLPRGCRQVRHRGAKGAVYRDVVCEPWGVIVELDGLAWHSDAANRWADMSRDLEAAVDGHRTLRLGWPHVVERRCETAVSLASVLRSLGWTGSARPCGSACALSGRSQSQGA